MMSKRALRGIDTRQRQMEREIGPNPKYRNGPKASAEEIAAWTAKAHQWIRDHSTSVKR